MLDTLIDSPIRPRARRRRAIRCPESAPLIYIRGIVPGSHTLLYADSVRPCSRRKPEGAASLQVFVAITDHVNAALEEARYCGDFTKNPAVVQFDGKDNCKVATYYARWARRGEYGAWSSPLSVTIAA